MGPHLEPRLSSPPRWLPHRRPRRRRPRISTMNLLRWVFFTVFKCHRILPGCFKKVMRTRGSSWHTKIHKTFFTVLFHKNCLGGFEFCHGTAESFSRFQICLHNESTIVYKKELLSVLQDCLKHPLCIKVWYLVCTHKFIRNIFLTDGPLLINDVSFDLLWYSKSYTSVSPFD